jgi:phage-related tail fiber protein
MVPAGTVIYTAAQAAPAGYLKANGAAVSRTNYANLFAAIGTVYGAGNGSTTFNVPDLRGEFLRGWDDGRGVDVGRTIGSAQGDAIRNITGGIGTSVLTWMNDVDGTLVGNGVIKGTLNRSIIPAGNGTSGGYLSGVTIDVSRQVPTASENRPRNVALLACIKY